MMRAARITLDLCLIAAWGLVAAVLVLLITQPDTVRTGNVVVTVASAVVMTMTWGLCWLTHQHR